MDKFDTTISKNISIGIVYVAADSVQLEERERFHKKNSFPTPQMALK